MQTVAKARRTPYVMPLVSRSTLFGEPWDPSRECWTLTRDDGKGKLHIGFVPWLPFTACPHRFTVDAHRLVAEWMPFPKWGDSSITTRLCRSCLRQPGRPWEMLLPSGFAPPADKMQALVIADWWEERGEDARATCIRSWVNRS